MWNYKNMLMRNWLQNQPVQQWYQSKGSKSWEKLINNRMYEGFKKGYLIRESAANTWNNQRRQLSRESKEMLRQKVKEIEAYNTSNCPNKKSRTTIEVPAKDNNSKKPTDMRIEEKLKYPENVHVKTDYMIEGTDFSNWDNIWYVSSAYKKHMSPTKSLFKRLKSRFRMEGTEENEKKFIFSYGIGEAVVETNENEIVIPCVLYTPEVTLNVLSLDQLLAQGFVITYGHNKCRISYMFGEENMVYDGDRDRGKGKECEIDTREMVAKHNKFLEEYFESIDPKDACPLIKGLEELEWDKDMEHDYLDDDYISVNGTLYAIKGRYKEGLVRYGETEKVERNPQEGVGSSGLQVVKDNTRERFKNIQGRETHFGVTLESDNKTDGNSMTCIKGMKEPHQRMMTSGRHMKKITGLNIYNIGEVNV
ncbi:hypothetical protein Tco_0796187 [Tanacetum coccineum]